MILFYIFSWTLVYISVSYPSSSSSALKGGTMQSCRFLQAVAIKRVWVEKALANLLQNIDPGVCATYRMQVILSKKQLGNLSNSVVISVLLPYNEIVWGEAVFKMICI